MARYTVANCVYGCVTYRLPAGSADLTGDAASAAVDSPSAIASTGAATEFATPPAPAAPSTATGSAFSAGTITGDELPSAASSDSGGGVIGLGTLGLSGA